MLTNILFALTALTAVTPAFAGDAEITLKNAAPASMAVAMATADATPGWAAVAANPDPLAAKTKASILIESLPSLSVSYNPDLLLTTPWGEADRGAYTIYAVDLIETDAAAQGGELEVLPGTESASIEAPRGLTWTDVGNEHIGYLLVSATAGEATLVLPITELGFTGVEPEEID